jgi:hypothetical protein
MDIYFLQEHDHNQEPGAHPDSFLMTCAPLDALFGLTF